MVAIRAYRRRWLGDAIGGVLAQTWSDFVLIIYDDAGDLDDLVGGFEGPRIRYLRAPCKREAGGRYCAALALCQAEFVALLDDDTWAPQFLEVAIAALRANLAAGMAYCRALEQLATGRRHQSPRDAAGAQGEVAERIFRNRWTVPTSLMMLRRSAVAPIFERGEIPEDSAPDVLMCFLLDKHGHALIHIPAVLCMRRVHGVQQMTRSLIGSSVVLASLEQMQTDDDVLERWRRKAIARRLVIRALHDLRHDQPAQARADLARAAALQPGCCAACSVAA